MAIYDGKRSTLMHMMKFDQHHIRYKLFQDRLKLKELDICTQKRKNVPSLRDLVP